MGHGTESLLCLTCTIMVLILKCHRKSPLLGLVFVCFGSFVSVTINCFCHLMSKAVSGF